MKRYRGFTLIELLVVISVIALLLSILMPSLQKAKRAAQRVVCVSNIKSQTILQLAYASANKGKFPAHSDFSPLYVSSWNTATAPANQYSQVYACLKSYVDNPRIFLCPIVAADCRSKNYDLGVFTTASGGSPPWVTWGYGNSRTQQYPWYVGSAYNWYANYRYFIPNAPGGGVSPVFRFTSRVPGIEGTEVSGEPQWPNKAEECTSSKAFVSHIMSWNGQTTWDVAHGGSYMGDPDVSIETIFKSADNPVGYSDGHVTWTKKSQIRCRAQLGGGAMEIFY